MSGSSKQANGRVLTSKFLVILDHSAQARVQIRVQARVQIRVQARVQIRAQACHTNHWQIVLCLLCLLCLLAGGLFLASANVKSDKTKAFELINDA